MLILPIRWLLFAVMMLNLLLSLQRRGVDVNSADSMVTVDADSMVAY